MAIRTYQGQSPKFGGRVMIDDTAVLIGQITIGDDCSIWPYVAARGDVNYIEIGCRTNIQDGSVLHVTRRSDTAPDGLPLTIGDDVTIGHKAMLHGCTVKNRVLIGMGAIILDGAIIEDDVIVGAGSLVPPGKHLKSGYLYLGNPVTRYRALKDSEFDFLKQSAANYVFLKDNYLQEQSETMPA
ncbi:gamma carbonic anhydrase family protein [Celerinatantimonas sp. YJH-8]|uniref:gamma carbonic anhydrase family protein n=1 Tax=Celerinatantimonas sp. YJH-8 TaxID=3228714 RepID=UPI0038BF678A